MFRVQVKKTFHSEKFCGLDEFLHESFYLKMKAGHLVGKPCIIVNFLQLIPSQGLFSNHRIAIEDYLIILQNQLKRD
jgi:hypothetical protein